jgi:excisionase family DNA binding protein
MSAAQVAEVLGVSEATVRRLIRRGQLRAARVGDRMWRVSDDDLSAYISEHQNTKHTGETQP